MAEIHVETEPRSIEIEFALTPAELRASRELLQRAARRQLGLERQWQTLHLLPWILLTAAVAMYALAASTVLHWVGLALCVAALLLSVLGQRWLHRREAAGIDGLKALKNHKQCWTMNDTGLRIRYRSQSYDIPWRDIAALGFQKGYIYLYLDSLIHLVVPERAFLSETQEKRFIHRLREHVTPGKAA
ncbi:MAG: YcxB family protein [Xanthomonadales bacterium]|nr:YcxB family protein [Xanthomonadales bacterium]